MADRRRNEQMDPTVMAAWIAGVALVSTGGLQVVSTVIERPAPLDCYEVRGEVLDQAEQNENAALVLFPSDSREQKECGINEYIVDIAPK